MNRARERENVTTTRLMMQGPLDAADLESLLQSVRPAPTIAGMLLPLLGDMSYEELGARAAIGRSTVYKIFDGTMKPQADLLLRIAFVLGMSCEDTQRLLKTGRRATLTASHRRDVAILYGLRNRCSLEEMDELLLEHGLEPLLPPEKKLSDFLGPRLGPMRCDELAERAHVEPDAVNALLAGKKLSRERAAQLGEWEKDDLLRIAFALGFNRERAQQMLGVAHRAYLNSKNPRDAAILEGLDAGLELSQMEDRLAALGLRPLTPAE